MKRRKSRTSETGPAPRAQRAARRTVSLKAPKPRNALVAAALFKKAGVHGKTRKAERRSAQVALRRELS